MRQEIQRDRNTREDGIVEFIAYRKDDRFLGVCLTFGLEAEGGTQDEAMQAAQRAAAAHLRAVLKHGLPEELLNRRAAPEHWARCFEAGGPLNAARTIALVSPSPNVFATATLPLKGTPESR